MKGRLLHTGEGLPVTLRCLVGFVAIDAKSLFQSSEEIPNLSTPKPAVGPPTLFGNEAYDGKVLGECNAGELKSYRFMTYENDKKSRNTP